MDPISMLVIAAIGVGLSAYGQYSSNKNAKNQANAQNMSQQQALQMQQQMDNERKTAMDLDALRRRREIVRQSVAARSNALAVATSQGAEGGSGLPGAYGGIAGRTGVNLTGINQQQEVGTNMFGLNAGLSNVYRQAATNNARYTVAGANAAGMTTLGNALLKNSDMIYKVGKTTANWMTPTPPPGGEPTGDNPWGSDPSPYG